MNANVRPLHANRDVTRDFSRNQNESKPKFEAKGHDRQLQDAQYSGRQIEIETMSGVLHVGVLIRRDRYTLTLRHSDGRVRMYFKHAIESIELDQGFANAADGQAAGETGV